MAAAQTTRKRARRGASRTISLLALIGAAGLIAAVVWSSMSHAGQPAQQQRVVMPGMGEHLVNLWVEQADRSGGQRLTAQITDISGWPEAGVSAVTFHVTGPDQANASEAPGAYSQDGPGRGQVFRAVVNMDGTGPWEVLVRYTMSGEPGEAVFSVVPE